MCQFLEGEIIYPQMNSQQFKQILYVNSFLKKVVCEDMDTERTFAGTVPDNSISDCKVTYTEHRLTVQFSDF